MLCRADFFVVEIRWIKLWKQVSTKSHLTSTDCPPGCPISPRNGFTFNQFLMAGDEPFLFHCGHRQLFGQVSEAIARVLPVEKLRRVSFGHVEADECGAMNQFLQAARNAGGYPQSAGLPGLAYRYV